MFDTMTMTKVMGAFCGALLVFLLGAWGAEVLYHKAEGHGDHAEQAYSIDTGEEDHGGEAEEVIEVAFADVYAAANAGSGERLWRQCAACHKLETGANGTGPYLHNVVGRDKGAAEGYEYSEILATMDGAWTPENLNGFLESPRAYAPGTKMAYNGMRDVEDRANLIAYLATITD